jgi:predicted TIM-barrel fold metal-dependent hydrolase
MAITRRAFLGLGACFGLGTLIGARIGLPAALGPGEPRPVTSRAVRLIQEAFHGLDREQMWDAHVHITGLGTGGTGCWVNPRLTRRTSLWKNFKFDVYRYAAGISDLAHADQQYVERLLALQRLANPRGKLVCLAFDYFVDDDGQERQDKSDFFVPNDYVLKLAREHPEIVPAASIHPYRKDAVERLDKAFEGGVVAVKWLPNAMGMDPASERCDPFYKRLAELGIPLISHAGDELAVDSPDAQELGNPLRLRRALDAGVRVVVAHCASLGRVDDLDTPARIKLPAFDAFMRLFTDRRFEKNLFADISAITQFHRVDGALEEILISKDLHKRLVNGSDYPLPCIDPLVSTRFLVHRGFIAAEDRELLNEIYDHNPLLFDFVLKRRVSVEHDEQSCVFSDRVFETRWLFDRSQKPA